MFNSEKLQLFKEVGYELTETATPRQPLMVSTCGLIVVSIDAQRLEVVHRLLGLEHLVHAFGTAHHKEIVDFLVKFVGTRKNAVVGRIDIQTEDGTAEGTDVREFVHIVQYYIEGLVPAP